MRTLVLALLVSLITIAPAHACRITKTQAQLLGIQAIAADLSKTAGPTMELKGVRFPSLATIAVDYLEGQSKMCWRATYNVKLDEKCKATVYQQEMVSCF